MLDSISKEGFYDRRLSLWILIMPLKMKRMPDMIENLVAENSKRLDNW